MFSFSKNFFKQILSRRGDRSIRRPGSRRQFVHKLRGELDVAERNGHEYEGGLGDDLRTKPKKPASLIFRFVYKGHCGSLANSGEGGVKGCCNLKYNL